MELLDIQATIECGFTLKPVHDMIKTNSHAIGVCCFPAAEVFEILIQSKIF